MGAPVTPSPPREGSYVTHFVSLAGTEILVIPNLTPARRQPRALRTAQFALLMLRRELPLASDSPERLDPREIQMNRALQLAKQEYRRNACSFLFLRCDFSETLLIRINKNYLSSIFIIVRLAECAIEINKRVQRSYNRVDSGGLRRKSQDDISQNDISSARGMKVISDSSSGI